MEVIAGGWRECETRGESWSDEGVVWEDEGGGWEEEAGVSETDVIYGDSNGVGATQVRKMER